MSDKVQFSMAPFVIGKLSVTPQVISRDGKFFPAITAMTDGHATDHIVSGQAFDHAQGALATAIGQSIRHLAPLMINRDRLAELQPGDRVLTALASVSDAEIPFQRHDEMVVLQAATHDQGPVLGYPDDTYHNIQIPVSFDGFLADYADEFKKVFAVLPHSDRLNVPIEDLVYQSCVHDPIPAGALVIFKSNAGERACYQIEHAGPTGYLAVPYGLEAPSEENAIELDFDGHALDGSGRATQLANLIPGPAGAAEMLKTRWATTELSPYDFQRSLSAGDQAARVVFSDHVGDLQNLVPGTMAMLNGQACQITETTNPDLVCVKLGGKELFYSRQGNCITEPGRKIDAIAFVVSGHATLKGAEHAYHNAEHHQLMVSRPMIDTSLDALADARRGDRLLLGYGMVGRRWEARVIRQESLYCPDKMLILIESPDPVERRIVGLDPLTGMVDCEGLHFFARIEHTPAGMKPAELLKQHLLHNESARDDLEWRLDMAGDIRPHIYPGRAYVQFSNSQDSGTGTIKLNLRDQTVTIDHGDGPKVFELFSRDAHVELQRCGSSVYADLLDRRVFDYLDAQHKAARAAQEPQHQSSMRLG